MVELRDFGWEFGNVLGPWLSLWSGSKVDLGSEFRLNVRTLVGFRDFVEFGDFGQRH